MRSSNLLTFPEVKGYPLVHFLPSHSWDCSWAVAEGEQGFFFNVIDQRVRYSQLNDKYKKTMKQFWIITARPKINPDFLGTNNNSWWQQLQWKLEKHLVKRITFHQHLIFNKAVLNFNLQFNFLNADTLCNQEINIIRWMYGFCLSILKVMY